MMNNKIVLYGAGDFGGRALNFYGIRNVYCFADNYKAGKIVFDKIVISLDELIKIKDDYEIIISVDKKLVDQMKEKLINAGVAFGVYLEDLKQYNNQFPRNPRILEVKNIHKGEKIFLLGNGPSLQIKDLEEIQRNGYMTMACNFINKIFEKTTWRPDYYCCEEESAILTNKDFILNYPLRAKFIRILPPRLYDKDFDNVADNVYMFTHGGAEKTFSENLETIVNDGRTVMFPMLEFAVYMGFKEIYLLGVDNTQPPGVHTANFADLNTHFYDEDASELDKRKSIMHHYDFDNNWSAYFNGVNEHYQVARDYAEAHGIKIFNATRGGALEVFERVNIDELLK